MASSSSASPSVSVSRSPSPSAAVGTTDLSGSSLASDANLLAYYRLEGNSLDETANNKDGTDTDVTYGTDYGKFAQGGSFNGTTSKITLGDNFDFAGDFSISLWVRMNAAGTKHLISKGATGQYQWSLQETGTDYTNTLRLSLWNAVGNNHYYAVGNVAINTGEWVHCVGTWDNTNKVGKVYVNGDDTTTKVVDATGVTTWLTNGTADCWIMGRASGLYTAGSIDDIALFSRVLTPTEVKKIFTGDFSPSKSPSPSATPSASVSATPSVSPSASVSATPSASPSVSVSATPSVSASVSVSATPSVSVSASPSVSPSVSVSASPSASPSVSVSATPSASASVSVSATPSVSVSATPSISPSVSESATPSISASVSPSVSVSATPSVSVSASPSVSPSVSVSATPSASASVSVSATPSASVSVSPSVSVSATPSVSVSATPSISVSASPSVSVSLSPSPSPSPGYTGYTRGDEVALPGNDADLETNYSGDDVTNVATKNDVRVDQTATQQYMIHQYKNFVGANTTCQLEWEGQTTLAPSSSTVYLQIYNRDTTTWDTVDSDNTSNADTDFVLLADVVDLTNYKDARNVISCRVYQEVL
jgi:hypothetical protein